MSARWALSLALIACAAPAAADDAALCAGTGSSNTADRAAACTRIVEAAREPGVAPRALDGLKELGVQP